MHVLNSALKIIYLKRQLSLAGFVINKYEKLISLKEKPVLPFCNWCDDFCFFTLRKEKFST